MDARDDPGQVISRPWCVLEVPGTGTQAEHAACVARIHENVRSLNGSLDAVDVGNGTSIYVEFDDLQDLLAFRLTEIHVAAYGLGDKGTWI